MTKSRKDERLLTRAAIQLQDEIEQMETLARRAAKVDLGSQAEILRAAELLKKSLESHGQFVAQFTALTEAVNAIRDRQNEAVAKLQAVSNALDDRRQKWTALERRFGQLGETAHEINTLMKGDDEDPSQAIERAGAVLGRLSAAVDEAKTISDDAKTAGFPELEKQADSMHQQLRSLVNKLENATRSTLN